MKLLFVLFIFVLNSLCAQADCLKFNDTCTVDIMSLRPAQFSVGEALVQAAVLDLRNLSSKKLQKEILKKPALVVLGPDNSMFVVDRNHFARELLDLNIHQMQAQVIDDASQLSWPDFWAHVQAKGEIYLYDESGRGPLDPSLLPPNIEQLNDDPYRSLAVMARDQGCYDKSPVLFADFMWGQFFRKNIPGLISSQDSLNQNLPTAMGLCQATEARSLPGFKP